MGLGRHVIEGKDDEVAEWVSAHIEGTLNLGQSPYSAIGAMDSLGNIVGGVVYNNFTRQDIHMHVAGVGNWLTRRMLGECFRYPFIQLGCRRVTGTVGARNDAALAFDEKLGFKYEGTLRCHLPDDEDLIILGMLREECRWLNVGVRRETKSTHSATTVALHPRATRPPVYAGLRQR